MLHFYKFKTSGNGNNFLSILPTLHFMVLWVVNCFTMLFYFIYYYYFFRQALFINNPMGKMPSIYKKLTNESFFQSLTLQYTDFLHTGLWLCCFKVCLTSSRAVCVFKIIVCYLSKQTKTKELTKCCPNKRESRLRGLKRGQFQFERHLGTLLL